MSSNRVLGRVCAFLLAPAFPALAGFSATFDGDNPFLSATGSTLSVQGDASVTSGILDLGKTGVVSLDGFAQPQGAFSVEMRVKLSQYGPLSTRYISDFVNTATWATSTPQGFTVRSGGGELYPVLAEEAYSDASGWAQGVSYFGATERASISRCLGEFSIATGGSYWKEVYTDRCLELDKWLHLVVTYDGDEMRYFVDGHDATDGWRVQAADATPVMERSVRLHIGASTLSDWDSRHAFAKMDFVTIHDSALKASQVRARYRGTLELPQQDPVRPTCRRTVRLLSPAPGEALSANSRIKVKVEASPECADDTTSAWGDQDTLEIQVSPTPDFSTNVEIQTKDTSVALGDIDGVPAGEAYVRCRVKAKEQKQESKVGARAAATTAVQPWEAARPTVVTGRVSAVSATVGRKSLAWNGSELKVQSSKLPKIFDLSGKSHSWSSHQSQGTWIITPSASAHGTYLVVTPGASSSIVLP